MEIDEKKLKEILGEQQEQMERYVGGLKEDFDRKLEAVLEYVKDVPKIKERQDVMFDQLGEVTKSTAVIKEAVKEHEEKLKSVEFRGL